MDCHLLVSDLFWPASAGHEPYSELALPALETLLARGRRLRTPGASLERALAAQYGLPDALPLAPFSLRGDGGEPGADWWLRADPVHLRIHRDELVLADASRLAVKPEEARDCVAALNSHFGSDAISFIAPHPDRWYARTANEPRLRTTPTSEAAGRGVGALLPQGDDGARWRRVINEAQMLLHEHPCNQARERQGQPAINSIWIWGPGRGRELAASFDAVWADDPVATGLAAASGGNARPLPVSGASLLETRRAGTHLVVVKQPMTAYGDFKEWRDALEGMERTWTAALVAGLWDGALDSLTLHGLGPDYGYTSVLTRRDRLRVWRTRRPLRAYAA
jgi:hypothetical protein